MIHKFTLYLNTRPGNNPKSLGMVLPDNQSQNGAAIENEFKAQLASVGLIENVDYYRSTDSRYRADLRLFVISGAGKIIYALFQIPQDWIGVRGRKGSNLLIK